MEIDKIYRSFIEHSAAHEVKILSFLNMKEISELGTSKPDKTNEVMGFGDGIEIISNLAAFVFLIAAQKIVEAGFSITKNSILNFIIEHREEIIAMLKRRYRDKADFEKILDKIIFFLKS